MTHPYTPDPYNPDDGSEDDQYDEGGLHPIQKALIFIVFIAISGWVSTKINVGDLVANHAHGYSSEEHRTFAEAAPLEFDNLMALARNDALHNDQIYDFIHANPKTGLRQIQALADQGDEQAELMACYILSGGRGFKEEPAKSIAYCESAAEKGNCPAMQNLAYFYDIGFGVEKNKLKSSAYYKKAFEVYWKKAEAGHARSQFRLGKLYRHGAGTWMNWDKALHYYTLSAESGFAEAQHLMGEYHYEGVNMPIDYEKAADYFHLSANQGHIHSASLLSHMYETGKGVKKDMEQAKLLREFAARHGDDFSVFMLAAELADGRGRPKDPERSFELMLESAQNGRLKAMYLTALNYEKGEGTEKNRDEAIFWMKKSAALGHFQARHWLSQELAIPVSAYEEQEKKAVAFLNGQEGEIDKVQGIYWSKEAAARGSVMGMMILSRYHHTGEGLARSQPASLYWIMQAAKLKPGYEIYVTERVGTLSKSDIRKAEALLEKCAYTNFYDCAKNDI